MMLGIVGWLEGKLMGPIFALISIVLFIACTIMFFQIEGLNIPLPFVGTWHIVYGYIDQLADEKAANQKLGDNLDTCHKNGDTLKGALIDTRNRLTALEKKNADEAKAHNADALTKENDALKKRNAQLQAWLNEPKRKGETACQRGERQLWHAVGVPGQ
jgi:hypothetical protein